MMLKYFYDKQFLMAIKAVVVTIIMTVGTLSLMVGCAIGKDAETATGVTVADVNAGLHFNPDVDYGSLTDSRDGQEYRTVKIGELMWMAENLNYKTDSSWCHGEADSNCVKYGRLYSWNAAIMACPAGWRLPDTADWSNLANIAMTDSNDLLKLIDGFYDEGKNLKSRLGWKDNDNAMDEYGFSALPGGYRSADGFFYQAATNGFWWTATEFKGDGYALPEHLLVEAAYVRDMVWFDANSRVVYLDKNNAYSVRCVREE